MVDQESGYRPRRAFSEPSPEPPTPPPPAAAPPRTPPPAAAPPRTPPPAPAFAGDDEDAPKPLFRDEYRPWSPYRDEATTVRSPEASNGNGHGNGTAHAPANGTRTPGDGPAAEPYVPGSDDTAIRSFTFAPRTRRSGEDTTTILARTGSSARSGSGTPQADVLDDDEERSPIGERARWGLAIGVIAAVVVLGLAIGYAVLGLGEQRVSAPSPSLTGGTIGPGPTTSAATEAAPTAGGPLLDDALMLTAAQAKALDDGRTWKETQTVRGSSPDGPVPACFGGAAVEGQPVSQQKIMRLLASSGKNAPKALHDATAYATPEEAATAYKAATTVLGTCPAAGVWLESGRVVRGVGDSAVGAVVAVVNGGATEWHSVLVARTGRVVNVLDASQPGKAVGPAAVGQALATVVKEQCGPAGGACAGEVSVRNAPPPLGGDEPGFLAVGDLPPVAGSATPWEAVQPVPPSGDFVGASCENIDWSTVAAEDRRSRVYLHPESKNFFGVNEILLTLKDDKAATSLVEKVRKDLESCKDRRATATVSKPVKVSGPGTRGTEVTGYTATVEQKGTDGSSTFRVGIVRAGAKVAYTFANPDGEFDFTDGQWKTIAVRAGERFTQVN